MKKSLYVKHTFLVWGGNMGTKLTPLYLCQVSEKDKTEIYAMHDFHSITDEPMGLKIIDKSIAMSFIDVGSLSCAF